MPQDYTGNSNKGRVARPEADKPKVIEQVTKAPVVEKKRSIGQKFKAIFFGGEFRSATKYIAADVLLPTFRNLIVDATSKGVERMVYGESAVQRRRPINYGSRIQYSNPLAGREPMRPHLPDQPSRMLSQRREPNSLILASREEADTVLERLVDIVDKYEVASLADLYDLTGLPSSPVDNKWGWSSLNTAEIRQTRDGYLLDLPAMEEI